MTCVGMLCCCMGFLRIKRSWRIWRAAFKYLFVPRVTHVSVLYAPRVVHASQEWSAETLKFPVEFQTPPAAPLFGGLAGLAGILLLAGPFVRETLGMPNEGSRAANEA